MRATTIWPLRASLVRCTARRVTVEDAGVAHARAAHAQQVVGARREELGVDAVAALDVLGGEDRAAGRDPSHERQRALHRHARQVLELQAP